MAPDFVTQKRQRRGLLWSSSVILLFAFFGYADQQRELQLAQSPLLPMTFAHADHVQQSCVGCHHNYVDDNDLRSCLDCHKSDPTIRAQIEPMFHGLCQGCHIEQALAGEAAGPARYCQGCHVADNRP